MKILSSLLNIGVGLLVTGISIPLVLEKIKMNNTYGIRIPKAFESEANWYAINAYGGKALIGWSIALIIIGIIVFFLPDRLVQSPRSILLFSALPMLFCIGAAVIQIIVFSRKF